MMETCEVDRIIREHLPRLQEEFGLDDMHINYRVCPCPTEGCAAEVCRDTAYKKATIYVDPDKACDEADVIDSVEHELAHCLHRGWDLFLESLNPHVKGDAALKEQLRYLAHVAAEHTVMDLLRMRKRVAAKARRKALDEVKAAAEKEAAAGKGKGRPGGRKARR